MSETQLEKPNLFSSPGLARVLQRLGLATNEVVEQVRAQGDTRKVISALALSGDIEESEALPLIARDLNIDYMSSAEFEVWAEKAKPSLFHSLNFDVLMNHRCIPIGEDKERLTVAFADPLDTEAVQELEFLSQKPVVAVLAREADIVKAISQFFALGSPSTQKYDDLSDGNLAGTEVELLVGERDDQRNEAKGSEAAPIVRLVNKLLADGAQVGASDVHLEPTAKSLEVRFRVDGILHAHLDIPKRIQAYVVARVKLLSGMDITEKRRPQDGRFRIRVGSDQGVDIRASSVPTPYGEKLVLRLLSGDPEKVKLDKIGMSEDFLEQYRKVLRSRDKTIIVTGPTGSGKSTTLYASLFELKQGTTNIITVEDPIEFRIQGITQMQVDPKVGMTFASGLRSMLRQDPDIILVGEIRDGETAEIAFQAAQTGHLVLSTLHTNDAPSAVVRLIDLGLERYSIAASLGAVVAQRLVRRVCESCARELTEEERESAKRYVPQTALHRLRVGSGCKRCDRSGYRGRVGVYSLLVIDSEIRDIIREDGSESDIVKVAEARGMKSLLESGLESVKAGHTTLAEIDRVIGLGEENSFSPEEAEEEVVKAVRHKVQAADSEAILKEADISIAQLAEQARDGGEEGAEEKQRVLLVDDDEGVRAVMSRSLRKADFIVFEAENGYEALDALKVDIPDIVVCDLVMPGLNGLSLVEEMRRQATTKEVPVLMLTGSDSQENEIALIEAGANDFVSKASSPALVIARMKRLLK